MKNFLIFILGLLLFVFADGVSAAEILISNPSVSNDEVTIEVLVTGLVGASCPNTKCFLQGMFTKSTSSPQYFGYTQNKNGDWYKYFGSPEKNYILSTFFYFESIESSWSGQLKVKSDPDDSDYLGPGEYFLRVRRYTGNSTSPTSEISNDLPIQLSYVIATPTPAPTVVPTASPTPTPTLAPTKTPIPTHTPTKSPTPKPTIQATETATEEGEVDNLILGLRDELNSSPSPEPEKEEGRKFPVFPAILIFSGIFCIGFAVWRFYENKKNS